MAGSVPVERTCSCNDRPFFPAKVRASVNGFERVITFRPGYACERDRTDGGSHGKHGMDMLWLLIGPKGAIQFVVYTMWEPTWERRGTTKYGPMPADIGYHAKTQKWEGQEGRDDCPWITGTCYYDGSGLRAENVFKLLLTDGEEAVWEYLEAEYESQFGGSA